MFAAFKSADPEREKAEYVYALCLAQARNPRFYRDYGVPDTFDGRFDLLVVHMFLVMDRLKEEASAFNQNLFDAMFADMDQTLREMGVGDMGVPKRMKRMMTAFNGRLHAYERGLAEGTLAEVLERNLYSGAGQADKMERYIMYNIKLLGQRAAGDIVSGRFDFEEDRNGQERQAEQ